MTAFILALTFGRTETLREPFTPSGLGPSIKKATAPEIITETIYIILAAIIIPLALLTLYRGWTDNIQLHKKIAKITLPLWLYVSVTGVAIYFMLY